MADTLDEQFNLDLLLVKSLINQLIHIEDKEICYRWLRKLCSLRSAEPLVKKHRNSFLKYMLKIIKNNTLIDKNRSFPGYDDNASRLLEKRAEFTSHWSADGRTYVAVKALPGRGALLYTAVTKHPELGWDYGQA